MNLDEQKAHPIDSARELKKEQALALRIARSSYRQIARALGVSVSTAHELVTEALEEVREVNRQSATELKNLEVALLDEMTLKLWPKAAPGSTVAPKLDPRTADTILRISERRAKLLGLDAPIKGEWSGPGGGPIPLVAAALDPSKLSTEDLIALEKMYSRAGALPAGAPVPTPSPEPSHNGNGPHA